MSDAIEEDTQAYQRNAEVDSIPYYFSEYGYYIVGDKGQDADAGNNAEFAPGPVPIGFQFLVHPGAWYKVCLHVYWIAVLIFWMSEVILLSIAWQATL